MDFKDEMLLWSFFFKKKKQEVACFREVFCWTQSETQGLQKERNPDEMHVRKVFRKSHG